VIIMNANIPFLVLLLASAMAGQAQEPQPASARRTLSQAGADLRQQLEAALAELAAVNAQIEAETLPSSRELNALQDELIRVRQEHQEATRQLSTRNLDVANLLTDVNKRSDEVAYVTNQLNDYLRQFEARLHVAELRRYEDVIGAAKVAGESAEMAPSAVLAAQSALVAASLERLHDALGGARFEGSAVDPDGMVRQGTLAAIGPCLLFRSNDGAIIGTAEQRVNSLEPAVLPYPDPEDGQLAARFVADGTGTVPLDPTLGNAHKLEATRETLLEHIEKGGPVMVPILALAAAALLVALLKWLGFVFVRRPQPRRLRLLLDAVARRDEAGARACAAAIRGPTGRMLRAGVEHMREPRELIEEVMYETVLTTRLRLQRFLPFISISAASAPLLGLLGTVTGIISTFKLITVHGSGDVKLLSSGISEALITTEFGLIVAIPSLLLHAWLSRKARGVVARMETAAVAFVNQVSKTPLRRPVAADAAPAPEAAVARAAPDPSAVRAQVKQIMQEILGPLTNGALEEAAAEARAHVTARPVSVGAPQPSAG
jgi:biopolymer transport protein ExbB